MAISYNRSQVINNPHQGKFKKVLCVCTAGCLRSPTAAEVLSQSPYEFNTRAAGIEAHSAIIGVDDGLVEWADEIVVMEKWMKIRIEQDFGEERELPPIHVLDIPDNYGFRHPTLIKRIKEAYYGIKDPSSNSAISGILGKSEGSHQEE